jgi:hypothetical protein
MISELIFATNNPEKLLRLGRLTAHCGLRIRPLKDFINSTLPEPEENGATEISNATIKARYYSQIIDSDLPILAWDDGVYTNKIPNTYNCGKNVKATVTKHMGDSSFESISQYWHMLSKIYPNTPIQLSWNYCLIQDDQFTTGTDIINCQLRDNPQTLINDNGRNSPLGYWTYPQIGNVETDFNSLTDTDYQTLFDLQCKSLKRVLS